MGKLVWQRANRARDGGQPQRGPIRNLIAEELRKALFGSPSRAAGGAYVSRGAQWCCSKCNVPNDMYRKVCRRCGSGRPTTPAKPPTSKRSSPPAPNTGHGSGTNVSSPTGGVAPVPPRVWPRRPPAPEVKSAAVESQTAALASAAAVLREAVLNDAAGLLEAPAKQVQRVAGCVENTRPGARLDACTEYVQRAERRLVAADKAVKDAEAALETARAQRAQLDQELAEGRDKLEQLKNDVLPSAALDTTPQTLQVEALENSVQSLLAALDQTSFEVLPSSVREAMESVHGALGTDNRSVEETASAK